MNNPKRHGNINRAGPLKTQQDCLRPQLEHNIHRVLHHGQYILGPEVAELEEKLAAETVALLEAAISPRTKAIIPLNLQPAVADEKARLPVGDAVAKEVMSWPMSAGLAPAQQAGVVQALVQAAA